MSVHKTKDGRWFVAYRDADGRQRRSYTGRGRAGEKAARALDHEIKAAKHRGRPDPVPRRSGLYLDELARAYTSTTAK